MSEGQGAPDDGAEVVLDLPPLSAGAAPFHEGPERPVERTRALLAYLLFGLLTAEILGLMALIAVKRLSVADFNDISAVVVTPTVGLLGAATGYYYGRGDR